MSRRRSLAFLGAAFACLGAGESPSHPESKPATHEERQVKEIKARTEKEPGAPETPVELSKALAARRLRLEEEEARLARARADLAAAEGRVLAQIEALKKLRAENEQLLKEIEDARRRAASEKLERAAKEESARAEERERERAERVQRLVKLIEKMPPGNAATYLESFEEDVAASVLGSMSIKKAAQVVAAMAPARAASLTRSYLSRDQPKHSPSVPRPTP